MFEKSKAADDSGAMLSMGYAVEFADSMSSLFVQHVGLSKEVLLWFMQGTLLLLVANSLRNRLKNWRVFESGKTPW
jgi:hypothetical protein